jgi:hypothetical protein
VSFAVDCYNANTARPALYTMIPHDLPLRPPVLRGMRPL